MSELNDVRLPKGWAQVRLADVLSEPLINGRSVKTMEGGFPVLRLTALKPGGVDLSEHKNGAWSAKDADRFLVSEGDFLVSRGNGSIKLVGRGALVHRVTASCAFPDTMIRIRINHEVMTPGFLNHIWHSPLVRNQIEQAARTTAGIYKINQAILESIELPLPPLAEQRRIVEALERHLSRLDAAVRELDTTLSKITAFRKSTLLKLVPETPPPSWRMTTTGEAGAVELGRQRHPDWHHGSNMRPYLRVANVFEDRIDTSDVMEMDFSDVFEKYRLKPGDVLLNEGQSPHLVGRPALYRGTPPNVAYTNSLLRFRAGPDVLPEWALMVFRRHMHARRFMREVRITTNIAHLSSKRLKKVEFPIPPLDEQKELVKVCDELMSNADAMERTVQRSRVQAGYLRSSLLNRAFTGTLVRHGPVGEPASALLEQIEAERKAKSGATAKAKHTARRPRRPTGEAPPPPAATVPVPTTAVQQELPL